MQGGWASTVTVDLTERALVANNRIWNNDGEAVAVILSNNVTVTGNENYDNFSQGVYIDNSRFNKVDGNLIYSTGNTRYFRDGYPGMGIAIANEYYDYSNPSSDNTIINNIIVNTRWGFLYGNFERGGGLKNTVIANNTFYKSSQAMIEIWQDAHANSVVENNVFYQVGGTAVATLEGSGVTFRHNNWYGGTPTGATAGAGDVYGNPAFANAGGLRAIDYKLTASSMAIAKALDLGTTVRTDFFGATRVAPFDMGAHQYSIAGPIADTQAPSAPTSLRPVSGDSSRVDIAWNAATDNVAVTGYTILRNGTSVGSTAGLSFSDTSVVSGTKYSYQIVARDAAGNQSTGSNLLELAFNNSHAETPDTTAPTAPAELHAGIVTSNSIELIWSPSTDDVAVARYKVYRDGAFMKNVTGTTAIDGSRGSMKTHRYYVVAMDTAGNFSSRSNTIVVTTKAAGRTRSAGR
jgi:parallel beta-helix repeat protein